MKFFKYVIYFIILILTSVFIVNSTTFSNPHCIYDVNSHSVTFGFSSDIGNGLFDLGEPTTYSSVNEGCSDLSLGRKGYQVADSCKSTFSGFVIYDNFDLINYFKSNFPTFDETKLVDFTSSCSGDFDSGSLVSFGDGESSTSSNIGSSEIGNSDNSELSFDTTSILNEKRETCKSSGGIFGFFSNKESCESIKTDSISCIYNPYLGGLLSSNFLYLDEGIINYDPFETSCVPKISFERCNNFKSKSLCENNENNLTCIWVDSKTYSPLNNFNFENGICITNYSNSNGDKKDFNLDYFYDRKNYIKNPSFELTPNLLGWSNSSDVEIIQGNTFDGLNMLKIKKDNFIYQNISNIKSGIIYLPYLFLKVNNYTENSKIKLELKLYDKNNNLISIENDFKFLSDIYSESQPGYFKRVNFNSFNFNSNVNYITIFIISENVDSFVDGISFEPISKDGISISDLIFKPVEILSSNASNCNLCFDKFNLNFCTENKSNLLGDCSYMVKNSSLNYESSLSNPDKYLGKNSNLFMTYNGNFNWDKSWQYQSLSNSKLFCELYVKKEQCVDPNNYVNLKYAPYHQFRSGNLCKWSDNFGCFKDSNGDGMPDTREGFPLLRDMSEEIKNTFKSPLNNYDYNLDFNLSCDTLPPSSYIYFEGVNASGNEIIITSNNNKLLGNIFIKLYSSDPVLEQCSGYNINKKLYVDYLINDEYSGHREVNSNQLIDSSLIQDYFRNSTSSLIQNGENNISIIVKDQSGNYGVEHNFTLNVDLYGPKINLTNTDFSLSELGGNNWMINSYLNNNSEFNFSISDFSSVDSCEFNLNPISENVDSSFYISQGDFNLSLISDLSNFNYTFKLPIFNSSSNGDNYKLNITCSDIFNQKTSNIYFISVDYSTDLILVEPMNFIGKDFNVGVFNSTFNISLISSDKGINNCKLNFTSGENFDLGVIENLDGFSFDSYTIDFYNNITGLINFNSQGFKSGSVECEDQNGNQITKNILYLFDSISPTLKNYSLMNLNNDGVNSTYYFNNSYYTWDDDLEIKLIINSTGSYLKQSNINLSFIDNLNNNNFNNLNFIYSNFNITDSINKSDSFEISSLTNFMNLGYYGINLGNNLYLENYSISFYDTAGNNGQGIIQFYYDKSNPDIIFHGDISGKFNGNIYTKSLNPLFNISFNTPKYRNFTCNVLVNDGNYQFNKNFDSTNNLLFKLNDILGYGVDLSENKIYSLSFNCIDVYGKTLTKSFNLKYDNTKPILNNIYLANGNNKYFINNPNAVYFSLIDDLVFDLEDTNEDLFNCSYYFTNLSDYYFCNSSIKSVQFLPNDLKSVNGLNLIGSRPVSNDNGICLRTDSLKNKQSETTALNENFLTKIQIKAVCTDAVGFKTNISTLDFNINYITGGELIDFKFDFKDQMAIPVVRSMIEVPSIIISYNSNGLNPLLTLNSYQVRDGIYIYSSTQGIPFTELKDVNNIIWAVAKDNSGNIIDKKFASLKKDLDPPLVNLFVPDVDENNYVYSNLFGIKFNSVDLGSGISSIKLTLDGETIFSYDSNMSYDDSFIEEPVSSLNYFENSNKKFEGFVVFKNAQIGQTYSFNLVSTDFNGNQNSTSITINVKDGIGIILEDYENNSYVDDTRINWITGLKSPIISFRTSKHVNFCSIYPFMDDSWKSITNNEDIASTLIQNSDPDENNLLVFNLSTLLNFDLSNYKGNLNPIRIICSNGTNSYSYIRNLRYVDYLTDYVLNSSNGFVLNEEPYSTLLKVKSVGPLDKISCKYSIDSGNFVDFIQDGSNYLEEEINFNDYSTGVHTLNLVCLDILGNEGPLKKYNFSIDKSNLLKIDNFKLYSSSGFEYLNSSNGYNIPLDSSSLTFEFRINMKSSVSCSYSINPSGDLVSGIISYFKNLFSIGVKEIDSSIPYEFKVKGLNFNEGNNILKIDCSNPYDSKSISFNIFKGNSVLGVNSSMEFLN